VETFGSFKTEIYLPDADIDLVILKEDSSERALFNSISKVLLGNPDYENVSLLANAKVPIIKFVEKSTKIK
jgi:non-canonical poly(A) RNA polymerase PAPD5/7